MNTVTLTITRNGQEIEVEVSFTYAQPYQEEGTLTVSSIGHDQFGNRYALDRYEAEEAMDKAWCEVAMAA